MKRLVLHIGSAKCGSSSIQAYLGDHFTQDPPCVNTNGETVGYAAIWGDRLLLGRELADVQRGSVTGYVTSAPLGQMDAAGLADKLTRLKELAADIDIVILSCESWTHEAHREGAKLFWQLGVPVDLIFVIRPPVELMNSAWWQWGVWTGLPVEQWCSQTLGLVRFASTLASWKTVGPFARTKIIELAQDPVRQFLDFLQVDVDRLPHGKKLNVATNDELLRHIVRNKTHYGRDMHKPQIEFQLNKILVMPTDKPPSVISPAFARQILESIRESSVAILDEIAKQGDVVSEAAAEKYLNTSYYDNHGHVTYGDWIVEQHSDQFIRDLISNILTLDRRRADVDEQLRLVKSELETVTSTRLWRLRMMVLDVMDAARRLVGRTVPGN